MKNLGPIYLLTLAAQSAAIPVEKRQLDLSTTLGSLFNNGVSSTRTLSDIIKSSMGFGGMVSSMATGLASSMTTGIASSMASTLSNMVLKQVTIKAASIEKLQPKLRDNAKKIRMKYGPFKVKGTKSNSTLGYFGTGNFISMDPAGTSFIQVADIDFPTDAMILSSTLGIIGDDGNKIDIAKGLYPHHAIFVSTSRLGMTDFLSCNGKALNIPTIPTFIGSAAEVFENHYTGEKGGVNSGFYLPKGDKIILQIDMVNYKEYDQNIYLMPEIEYLPGKPQGYLDSNEYIISPNTCDTSLGFAGGISVKPPPGVNKFSINGTDMTFEKAGYIIFSRGHMHDGGVDVTVKLNGKQICDSKATYGGNGRSSKDASGKTQETLSGQTDCPPMIKVKKGDKFNIAANYDLDLHPARASGGMGGGGHDMGGGGHGGHGDGMAEEMALLVMQFAPLK